MSYLQKKEHNLRIVVGYKKKEVVWFGNEVQCQVKKPNKGSKKAQEEFVRWLKNKNIVTVKYFQSDCELKWLINNDSERLCAKENESGCKSYAKISENNRKNICEHDQECNEIYQSCAEVIGVFFF